MRYLLVLSACLALLSGTTSAGNAGTEKMKDSNKWIKLWAARDKSIWPAATVAANIFRVSEGTMRTIVNDEGGNVNPGKLAQSLCSSGGIGWNTQGSSAFGPFQFMLDHRGVCFQGSAWGTFGSYDDAAFKDAKRRGYPVPYRFKHPASNVGQAITAAFMLATGHASAWCASQC